MIDHLVGRPSPSWKRTQVFLVIFFWLWRIVRGNAGPPRVFWLPRINRALKRFTPWQTIVSTLTAVYAIRNFDKILGLSAPEPLARLYSPSYYRATWIVTGFDAGFATAMSIRPKWLRDICSIIFSVYYIIYANEGDEKLRRFRAVPTVEMLRATWEKTSNPYIRMITRYPPISVRRKILLPRPKTSSYKRPITAYLFFALPEKELCKAKELILEFPGGGFVAMNPEHHEERLRAWAVKTRRPILAIDYGKSPEYPYPFACDEAFDTYRLLLESNGALIGMSGKKLSVIMSGDSAGATLCINAVLKVLEHNQISLSTHQGSTLPLPMALVLNYAALDFNFTSWMSADNLRVLRSEQSSGNLPGIQDLAAQKDHLQHVSPLSMVRDKKPIRKRLKRRESWKDTLRGFTSSGGEKDTEDGPSSASGRSSGGPGLQYSQADDKGALADAESEDEDYDGVREEDRPIQARVRYTYPQSDSTRVPRSKSALAEQQQQLSVAVAEADTKATQAMSGKDSNGQRNGENKEPIGTRLTMTSRTGYFQDRIVSPSMMRAMAILYIGPHRNPDFATDYHLSPILTPAHLLAQFPPLLMQCGEKDPFVDDTVIFAGRVREAKRARKVELDLALSGKSARFGESLRMSITDAALEGKGLSELKKERDKLASETDSDWVQMVLFSEWSHGYLQMPTLMHEAKAVIEELAEWIDHTFVKYKDHRASEDGTSRSGTVSSKDRPRLRSPPPSFRATVPSPLTSETETDDSTITFIPKKYQDESRRGSFGPSARQTRATAAADLPPTLVSRRGDSSGSDATLLNERTSSSSPNAEALQEGPGANDIAAQTGEIKSSRITGQTITETELMRRRRLLDSHIFD
ncbi:Alpha/Beta hydrolase protein [Crucibulum laeve]|uniref:Alpha/Beta hydrolase protein n=1 Tax=Crucibulum laeve TaxID=68775 RepID=A0A5C3MKF0_9AGAR|nr:Alpha/Beta hydrolase protein [Crucibulum laeve]